MPHLTCLARCVSTSQAAPSPQHRARMKGTAARADQAENSDIEEHRHVVSNSPAFAVCNPSLQPIGATARQSSADLRACLAPVCGPCVLLLRLDQDPRLEHH